MKNGYKAKTLIPGFKLGMEFAGKTLVAVPLQYAIPGKKVFNGSKLMQIPKEAPLKQITQADKFGRGTFTLCYYEWDPVELWA